MLRLLLPPNLAAAAPRDAIAVKVELDLSSSPKAELLPALALLQRWCATPQPPPFVQLKRAQLRQLIGALERQPVFFWANAPATSILWLGSRLRGVTDFLDDDNASAPAAPRAPIKVPRSLDKNSAARFADALAPARQSSLNLRPTASSYTPEPRNTSTTLTVDGSEHYLAISLPSRESHAYAAALELVKSHGFILEPATRKWWLRDRHKVLNFLSNQSERLRTTFFADFTANFDKNTAHLRSAEILCETSADANGHTLTLGLKAGKVSDEQLLSAVAANRGYVEDGKGQIYLISPDQLAKLAAAQRALAGEISQGPAAKRTHHLSSAHLLEAQSIVEEIAPNFQAPDTWRTRSDALRHLDRLPAAKLDATLDALLRPYQRLGVAWLAHLYRNDLGGVLADEMGLGKTLQARALLTTLHPATTSPSPITPNPSPSLVVCPASLVENWRREAARFAPHLKTYLHHGYNRHDDPDEFTRFDLIITSYGTLARDRELFAEHELTCLIADEAQHLKNRHSHNATALRSINAKGRFMLTGTPLENSLDDLRSLFAILMPGFIPALPAGTRGEDRKWHDERLRARTAPYILRRTKLVVAPELPEKIEQVIYCEPTATQAALYRKIQEESERALIDLEASGASEGKVRFATLTQLLRLRQVCCDPRLVTKSFAAEFPDDSAPSDSTTNSQLPTPSALAYADSAKLEAFREILAEAIDDGHRILVFSQFTSLLKLLRAELAAQEIAHCYLDGSLTPQARQAQVDRFQNTADIPVFLISLKAGGTGLNLTAADIVIHFDPWWNPASEAQATDRAHRIGQTKVVTSYKLICTGTVEEKVLQLQAEKRTLLADVFAASDAANSKISLSDLRTLLKT